jgi:hypothetical protein
LAPGGCEASTPEAYPAGGRPLQLARMALERSLRGALAGGVAAGVWLAQQPLDQLVFRCRQDDAALLGKAVSAGPVAGAVLHAQNGALLGAVYAAIRPRLPLPAPLCGPLAALAEHVVTWPAVVLVAPELRGDARAFAQATWRHLLFGAVLGELERRLNRNGAELAPIDDDALASNGHGPAEHAVASV